MSYHMLIRRGSTWHFRRAVPAALRQIIGHREITRSLHTSDLREAKSRAITVAAEVDALLWRARRTLENPEAAVSAIATQLVREDREARRGVLSDDDQTEREQAGLTDELERLTERPLPANLPDAVQQRARIQALRTILAKLDGGNGAADAADVEDPLLSVLFERYRAERKLSPKVWREFDLVCRHFIKTNGDITVRAITKQHVRSLKTALLAMPSSKPRRGQEQGATLSASSVVKLLSLLRAVLEWGTREGFLDVNPAHGTARVASQETKGSTTADERRLPFTVEQMRDLLSKLPAGGPVRYVLLLLAYTGCRLAEVIGLRREDVRTEDGVTFFDVKPHSERSLKTKASRRRVPVHLAIIAGVDLGEALPFKGSPAMWSQKCNRWLRSIGFADARLVVHSFRHTVKDRLRAARVPEAEQRALLGHAGQGVADSYGSGFPLSVLRDAVNRIDYDGR